MNMRLAYRLACMEPCLLPWTVAHLGPQNAELARSRAVQMARLIARQETTKVILDNVARFYADHEQQVWSTYDDIPNWAPPFTAAFYEWNDPRRWKLPGGVRESIDGQMGIMAVAYPLKADAPDKRLACEQLFCAWCGTDPANAAGYFDQLPIIGDDSRDFGTPDDWVGRSRWLILTDLWGTVAGRPINGHPIYFGIYNGFFVDEFGRLLRQIVAGLQPPGRDKGLNEDAVSTTMHILGLGISFLHCKNVLRNQSEDDRGERWHRRTGQPRLRFTTIDINPMRQVLRTEGNSELTGIRRALHMVRGHFSHYTEDRPLFGRSGMHGDFWMPQHVRGSADQGAVVKDYAVGAPGTSGNSALDRSVASP